MDRPGIEAAEWSNPELVPVDSANYVDAAEPEFFDTSTVDPSHIIHLIRQLLPIGDGGTLVPLVMRPGGSGAVLKSHAEEVVLSDKDSTIQDAFKAVDDVTVNKNDIIHAGLEVGNLSTEQDNALDILSTGSGRESATTEKSPGDLKSEEGSPAIHLIHENGDHIEKDANHIEQNGNHMPMNRELSRTRSHGCPDDVELYGDVPDYAENSCWRGSEKLSETASTSQRLTQVEGTVEGKALDVPEVGCTRGQVEGDAHQKTGGDEDAREEAGCVLWDLAATESHANFLVEHHILDVLLAFLWVPRSDRMTEICLGVFGNLACHSGPVKAMVAIDGLVETIVQQLFLERVPILTETCRLLSAGLHSEVTVKWVESIKPDIVLERIMWIAANTLDSQLLEKCTELILVMVDSRRDAGFVLLPSLLRLGLPGLLTDLIECELAALSEGTSSRGDVVLDIVLQIAEAISTSDDSASQLAASRELFSLSGQVIQLSARDEIGPSAITATVLIANLLTEESKLIEQLLHDALFLGRLLALVPCAGEDPGARNALWSILGRICRWLVSTGLEDPQYSTSGMLAVLADGCSLLLDDLEIHQDDDVEEDDDQALAGQATFASTSRGLQAKLATVVNMTHVMEQWNSAHGGSSAQDTPLFRSVRNARMLLQKHISTNKILSELIMRDLSGDRISSAPVSPSKLAWPSKP